MVVSNRSTWCYVQGEYAVIVKCLTRSSAHTGAKNMFTNCVPRSVRRSVGLPYKMRQRSTKEVAMSVAVILNAETARVSLE